MDEKTFEQLLAQLRIELEPLDTLPLTFWMSMGKDENYRICYWNKGAEKIYGYTKEQAIGRSYIELFVSEEAAPQSKIDCDRVISGWQHPVNCLALDVDKDGNEVILLTNVFRYSYKGIYYHSEIAVNLTPSGFLKFLDEEYRRKRSGVEHEKERTLESFINYTHNVIERKRDLWSRTFAHEIRSELSAVKNALENLTDTFPGIGQDASFKEIQRAHQGLFLLSENFLFSQSFISAETVVDENSFYLNGILESAINEYSYWATLKSLYLSFEKSEKINAELKLKGSQDAFLNVIKNLLSNAVKHTPIASSYRVSEISVVVVIQSKNILIKIINPGNIADSDISHLFEPYYKDRQNPAEGSHLGLSIAKHWTNNAGGTLSLRNLTPGKVITELSWPLYL